MKKLVALLIASAAMLICGIDIQAQNQPNGHMEFSHGNFTLNGQKLDAGELHNYFNADEFETVNKALRLRKTGTGLLIAGGACAGVGLAGYLGGAIVCTDAPSDEAFYIARGCATAGLCTAVVGTAMLAAGAPLFCIGNSRLKQAALSFSAGATGVGLALKF